MEKPRLSFRGLWNLSFGFFGIQVAFGLQNTNISRIFQSLGSSIDDLAILWIAAPMTGLLVQPIIGHYSDRTWGRLGRRRPYFLSGAILAAAALFGMPHAPALLAAAVLLWMLDASLNISMEPFRAFVGDMTRDDQRAAGYAVQTMFIGTGAVLGSLAPFLMKAVGVANTAPAGIIPDSVRYSFYIGAAAIFLAVLWTVVSTREYSPEEMRRFNAGEVDAGARPLAASRAGPAWFLVGAAVLAAVLQFGLDKQLYVLGGGLAAFGLAQIVNRAIVARGGTAGMLSQVLSDLTQMPAVMRRLAVAQFFAWIALFIMWIYTTPVVTQYVFGSTDPTTAAYNDGADWVGVLFSTYNGVAAIAALALPLLARRIGAPMTHLVCLLVGAASYASIFLIRDAELLVVSMIGVGVAWASVLTMPYVILAGALPQAKLGVYLGIFNIFIVLPQLLIATIMGVIIKTFFPDAPIWTMVVAAASMGLAALAMLRVNSVPIAARTAAAQTAA